MAIDPADGPVRWKRPTGCAYRGCIYGADSEVWFHDAYRGHEVMDPDTGATVRKQLYQAIGGGCGIEVMTPDWIVRGSFLVPRDDEDTSFVLSAIRPNCEIPMYPAYGSIFTTGTGCGCDWYLEGSAFALHDGWVYALRVADGSIAWQRYVAPEHRLMTAFGVNQRAAAGSCRWPWRLR